MEEIERYLKSGMEHVRSLLDHVIPQLCAE
jgi:hypothetical protein